MDRRKVGCQLPRKQLLHSKRRPRSLAVVRADLFWCCLFLAVDVAIVVVAVDVAVAVAIAVAVAVAIAIAVAVAFARSRPYLAGCNGR